MVPQMSEKKKTFREEQRGALMCELGGRNRGWVRNRSEKSYYPRTQTFPIYLCPSLSGLLTPQMHHPLPITLE